MNEQLMFLVRMKEGCRWVPIIIIEIWNIEIWNHIYMVTLLTWYKIMWVLIQIEVINTVSVIYAYKYFK